MQGGLDDGVGLGMDRTDAMSIHDQMSNLIAVCLSGWGTVEARSEDTFVQYQDTTYEGAVTGAAL